MDSIEFSAGTFRCSLWLWHIDDINLPEYRKLLRLMFDGENEPVVRALAEWFPDRVQETKTAWESAPEETKAAAKRRYDKLIKRHDLFFEEVNKHARYHS